MKERKREQATLTPDAPCFSPPALANYLGVPLGTLSDWRYRGVGPKFYKVGKLIRYGSSSVAEWLAAQTRQQTPNTPRPPRRAPKTAERSARA